VVEGSRYGTQQQMRVIVCGGRNFDDFYSLAMALNTIHLITPITEVIEGGAKGADLLANVWATFKGIKVTTVRAEWEKYGKKAGMVRNAQMAEMKPDAVIAFPGGVGTKNMIYQAKIRGIQVCEVNIRERK